MRRPPIPRAERILTPRHLRLIFFYGTLMSLGVLSVTLTVLRICPGNPEKAVAMGFHAMVLSQLFFVFNVRNHSIFRKPGQIFSNPMLILSVLVSIGVQVFITYIPLFQKVLSIHPLQLQEWGLILAGAFLPTAVAQIHKIALGR